MSRWTKEARQQQAEWIRALCPWRKSTGPRTEEGKTQSARDVEMVFSSFGRKRGDNVQYRRCDGRDPNSTRRCPVRFAEPHHGSHAMPGCSVRLARIRLALLSAPCRVVHFVLPEKRFQSINHQLTCSLRFDQICTAPLMNTLCFTTENGSRETENVPDFAACEIFHKSPLPPGWRLR